jgi:hypothetical protein
MAMAQIGEERRTVTMAGELKKGDILREKLEAFRQTSDEADAQKVGDEIGATAPNLTPSPTEREGQGRLSRIKAWEERGQAGRGSAWK